MMNFHPDGVADTTPLMRAPSDLLFESFAEGH